MDPQICNYHNIMTIIFQSVFHLAQFTKTFVKLCWWWGVKFQSGPAQIGFERWSVSVTLATGCLFVSVGL